MKEATTSCTNTWDTVRHLAFNDVSMIFRISLQLPLSSKLLTVQHHARNFEEQLWKGEKEGLCVVSLRFLSSTVIEKEKMFLIANVSTILQLVVAGTELG